MNRISALWRSSPRTVLLGLGTIGLAAAVTVGSGADFTSASANPANVFTAGSMTHYNSKAGAAILTASNMRPGDTANGTVDIQNTGSLSGNFSLAKTATDTGLTPSFSSKLTVVITDTGDPSCLVSCPAPVVVYSGVVGAMGAQALGTFAAGATHRYTFAVTFPSTGAAGAGADNAYQGANTSVVYNWTATS
jgi:spore coat-associated protein N